MKSGKILSLSPISWKNIVPVPNFLPNFLNPVGSLIDSVTAAKDKLVEFQNSSDPERDAMLADGIITFAEMVVLRNRGNVGDDVIRETLSGSGDIRRVHRLSSTDALTTGEQFLGPGYKQLGKPNSGVFRSADGLRQFKIDGGSLIHPQGAHVSFEAFNVSQSTNPYAEPYVNNHVFLTN